MSVFSALRGAGRQLSTCTAALSALRGARRQLSTSTVALSALRGARRQLSTSTTALSGAGRRQLYTSTIAARASGACVFQIKDYTDVKRILGVGEDTTSDDFYVGDYRFRILCCPNGSSDIYADFVSVFLEYRSSNRDVMPIAKVKMSILPDKYSNDPTHYKTREEYRFKRLGDTWGWNDFISHGNLRGDPEPKQIASKRPSKDTSADWFTNIFVKVQDDLEAPPVKHVKDDCLTLRCDVSTIGLYRTTD